MRRVVPFSRSIVPSPGQPGNFLLTAGRAKDNALYRGSYQRARGKFIVRGNLSFERTKHLCHCRKIASVGIIRLHESVCRVYVYISIETRFVVEIIQTHISLRDFRNSARFLLESAAAVHY